MKSKAPIESADQLAECLEIVREYPEAGLNLAAGVFHGIGYYGDQLVYFKSTAPDTVVSRNITLADSLQWLESMELAADQGMMESTFTNTTRGWARWCRDLRAAIK